MLAKKKFVKKKILQKKIFAKKFLQKKFFANFRVNFLFGRNYNNV